MNDRKNPLSQHTPPLEIERKYKIARPNEGLLASCAGVRIRKITQTYLTAPTGMTRRVRRAAEGARVLYMYTEKTRLSALTAIENEREITEEDYKRLLGEADPARRPVEKRRYAFPYEGIVCEVDIYPFWQKIATLEIELGREDETPPIPPFLTVIADVTADKRYKNVNLAHRKADLAALEAE